MRKVKVSLALSALSAILCAACFAPLILLKYPEKRLRQSGFTTITTWAVVVALLVEWALSTLEIGGLSPDNDKIFLSIVQ